MMILQKIITPERIKFDIEGDSKWAVIDELADLIVESGASTDRETLIADTLEREDKGSTGIGDGIAIPHAKTTGVTDLVGALGVSTKGIDFESRDRKPSHLIFLILSPPDQPNTYLRALAEVAAIGEKAKEDSAFLPNLIAKLSAEPSPDKIMTMLGEVIGGNH